MLGSDWLCFLVLSFSSTGFHCFPPPVFSLLLSVARLVVPVLFIFIFVVFGFLFLSPPPLRVCLSVLARLAMPRNEKQEFRRRNPQKRSTLSCPKLKSVYCLVSQPLGEKVLSPRSTDSRKDSFASRAPSSMPSPHLASAFPLRLVTDMHVMICHPSIHPVFPFPPSETTPTRVSESLESNPDLRFGTQYTNHCCANGRFSAGAARQTSPSASTV